MANTKSTIETKEVALIRREVGGLVDTARDLVIIDEEGAESANELLVFIVNAKRKLEEQRTFLVKPLNNHVKDINTKFKEWVAPLEEADKLVRRNMLGFQKMQEALRAEAQRLEDEAKKLEDEANAGEFEAADRLEEIEERQQEISDLPVVPRSIKGTSGSTSLRKTWTFEVIDDKLLPATYLMVDEGAISLAVREGVRDIPGVRIFQQESLAVRAS